MSEFTPSASSEHPTNVRWMIFGLGCGTSWILYLHRYTFGIIKPELHKEWGLGKIELGWLDAAFSVTYSLAQVPAGLLGDLLGTHLFLSVTIIAWSLALALHGVATYEALYAVRVLFGLMQAGCYPMLSKMSKTWFPPSVRTTLQGWIASFFGRMGGAMSNVIFATLLIGYLSDWRLSLYILSAAGVVFGAAFALMYRNTPREHPGTNRAEVELIEGPTAFLTSSQRTVLPPGTANCPVCGAPVNPSDAQCRECGESFREPAPPTSRLTYREMFSRMSRRSVWNFTAFLIQQFTSTFADMIYMSWIPYFLLEEHGMKFKEMGIYASLPMFGGACGGAFGGYLNDFLILRLPRRWARTLVGFSGKMTACLLIFVALANYDDPYVFCIILFFVKFFSDWSQPTVWGTVTDIGGPATATVFGFNNMVGGFGGNVSPVVFGYIATLQGWTPVFTTVGAAYLLSSVSWLFVDCTVPLMREEPEE
jgi:MFS transporter, ACS family, glucarate transporter